MGKNNLALVVIALFHAGVAAESHAQAKKDTERYPVRPIRVIVPFTPGGQPDIVARLIAPRLSEIYQQQIVVDNRAGAGGVIGIKMTATASPDGYTLMSTSAAHSVIPHVRANPGYDTIKDFSGITLTATAAYYLVVPATLEVKNVKDLIALAKAKPGQLNFASAGTGSATHFGAELFRFTAGMDMVHIPHRGIPEALTDTVAGRSQFFMAPFGSSVGLIKEGRLRALAVSTAKRSRVTPDIPTLAESGVPGFRYDSWNAWYAPVNVPRAIINRLNADLGRVLKMNEVADRLLAIGIEPAHSTPEELDKFTIEQVKSNGELARRAGIKPE